jgi:hypothetical protein
MMYYLQGSIRSALTAIQSFATIRNWTFSSYWQISAAIYPYNRIIEADKLMRLIMKSKSKLERKWGEDGVFNYQLGCFNTSY